MIIFFLKFVVHFEYTFFTTYICWTAQPFVIQLLLKKTMSYKWFHPFFPVPASLTSEDNHFWYTNEKLHPPSQLTLYISDKRFSLTHYTSRDHAVTRLSSEWVRGFTRQPCYVHMTDIQFANLYSLRFRNFKKNFS